MHYSYAPPTTYLHPLAKLLIDLHLSHRSQTSFDNSTCHWLQFSIWIQKKTGINRFSTIQRRLQKVFDKIFKNLMAIYSIDSFMACDQSFTYNWHTLVIILIYWKLHFQKLPKFTIFSIALQLAELYFFVKSSLFCVF